MRLGSGVGTFLGRGHGWVKGSYRRCNLLLLALGFRFDRASPAATKWAKQEAGKLVTDIIESQKLLSGL